MVDAKLECRGTGRRKEAVARVRLLPGGGRIIVNERPLEDYFPSEHLRRLVIRPLEVTKMQGKFDVHVRVTGGGISGQAGAINHGLARALLAFDERLRPALKQAGLLTRDARVKERKKYGLKKARKAPQFSKR